METLLILSLITGLLLWYALQGRDWLKSKSWASPFFEWVEPVEIALFKKSETVLFARTLQGLGGILSALTWLGSIDVTPILPLFPEQHQELARAFFSFLPLVLNGLGAIVEWLRNRTTKPIELVAVAEKDITLEVAAAIGDADFAKTVAVQTVEAAKAA